MSEAKKLSEMHMDVDTSMAPVNPVYPTAEMPADDVVSIGSPPPVMEKRVSVYANNITPVSYGDDNSPLCCFDVVFSVGVGCEDGTTKTYQVVKRIGIDKMKICAEAEAGTPVSIVEDKKEQPTKFVISESKRFRILAGLE